MFSSDLETGITQQILQKKPKKTKKKPKPTSAATTNIAVADTAKNEGDDPHWAYAPPEGAVLLDHGIDVREFEWDAVKEDEETEIWLVRVPDTVRRVTSIRVHLPH